MKPACVLVCFALAVGVAGCSDGTCSQADASTGATTATAPADDINHFVAGDGRSLLPQREGGQYFTPIRPATPDHVTRLKVPQGFQVAVWAEGLGGIRMMALGHGGTVYVTRPSTGEVLALRDQNGRAGAAEVVARLGQVHGIYIHRGQTMYLATVGEVYVCDLEGERVSSPRRIIQGMPTAPGHHNRTLAVGPDGRLYITVGATGNCIWEKNAENATMLAAKSDGSDRRVFARGLRNTIGFGWHPETGALWGMDHGTDWLGDDIPPEELNHIEEGRHYGWPYVYGERKTIPLDRHEPVGSLAEFAKKTTPPVLGCQAHSSPIAMAFYTGSQFPAEYRNDALVALHGSWNREPPVGYKVVRIRFRQGQPVGFDDFLTGVLVEEASRPYAFGRPAGLLVTDDGSLLVGDDANGVIYRVRYEQAG